MLLFIVLSILNLVQANDQPDCGYIGKRFHNRNNGRNGRFKRSIIMGGNEMNVRNVPWVMRIDHFQKHICTGTLLSDRHVLTAAHCFTKEKTEETPCEIEWCRQYSVCHLISNNVDDCPQNQTYGISNFHFLGRYVNNQCPKDIDFVVLELSTPIEGALPVCLPSETSSEDQEFDEVSLLGYSNNYDAKRLTRPYFTTNTFLKYVDVKEPRLCDDDSFLCSDYSEEGAICKGDSGGPMVSVNEGKATLIGINNLSPGKCEVHSIKKFYKHSVQKSVNVQNLLDDITSVLTKEEEEEDSNDNDEDTVTAIMMLRGGRTSEEWIRYIGAPSTNKEEEDEKEEEANEENEEEREKESEEMTEKDVEEDSEEE